MKRIIAVVSALALTLSLFACSGKTSDITQSKAAQSITEKLIETVTSVLENKPHPSAADSSEASEAVSEPKNFGNASIVTADFAFKMLAEAIKQNENAVISPVSLITALSITANGAKGDTLREMEKVLGADVKDLNQFFGAYSKKSAAGKLNGIKLANSIWLNNQENRLTVNENFIKTCNSIFGAEIFSESFDKKTLKKLNNWVSQNTDGTIKNMLEEIPAEAVVYIVNTILFDAEWKEPYTKSQVRNGIDFTAADGSVQKVTMLLSEERIQNYFKLGRASGISRDYSNGCSFAAILPDEGVTVEQALKSFACWQ